MSAQHVTRVRFDAGTSRTCEVVCSCGWRRGYVYAKSAWRAGKKHEAQATGEPE